MYTLSELNDKKGAEVTLVVTQYRNMKFYIDWLCSINVEILF